MSRFISEKERYKREAAAQTEIVSMLEASLCRPLTDSEKIRIFKGSILLPIKDRKDVCTNGNQ